MINKVLVSGYNDSGLFPPAALIPTFSKGFDKTSLHKRASIFENDYDKFERKPGYTYIHLISCAAGEHYGPNSRADFYNGDSYKHTFAEPEKGGPSFIILDGGLNKFHNKTFMEHGGVFTEHFSDQDGATPQGYIVAAKMNPEMKRGELIIGVNSPEWAGDLNSLANGKPLKFSIGALTSSDRCSYCGHVAHTEDEHCDHYKNHKGEITEDGSQIYVITDTPMFHDISRVKSPAEKIAFSIKKVASATNDDFSLWKANIPGLNAVRGLVKTANGLKRFDTLAKLAAIEKRIIAEAGEGSLDDNIKNFFKNRKKIKKEAGTDGVAELRNFLNYADEHQVFSGLHKNKCVLSPSEFIEFVVPKELQDSCHICHSDVEARIPGIFQQLLHSDDVDSFCEDNTYDLNCDCSPMLVSKIKNAGFGCNTMGDLLGSIINSVIPRNDLTNNRKAVIITISKPSNSVSDIIAKDYANYMLSATDGFSPEELTMTLLDRILC